MAIAYDIPSNTITVTGYTEGVPCTMHDVFLADVAGGWGVVSEYVQDRMYQCAAILRVGNNVTETWFQSMEEAVHFPTSCYPIVTVNATLTLGDKATDAWRGSFWQSEDPTVSPQWAGTFRLYASIFQMPNPAGWRDFKFYGTNIVEHSLLQGPSNKLSQFTWMGAGSIFEDVYFAGGYALFTIKQQYTTPPKNVVIGEASAGIQIDANNVSVVAPRVLAGVHADRWIRLYGANTTVINPGFEPTRANIEIKTDASYFYWDVLVDIHVVDKDGADLAGVGVECRDQFDAVVFGVNTAADGTIVQQQIHCKYWEQEAETETDYGPHKFTFTFPDGSQLILDPITVDQKINWHIEQPDMPAEANTRNGIAYADGSLTGVLVLPAETQAQDGVGFGADGTEFTGNRTDPAVGKVIAGTVFGANGTEKEGTYHEVEEAEAQLDVEFGADGVEYRGRFVGVSHYLEGEVETPSITSIVEAPTIMGDVD